jgi:hypothetical protein
MNETKEFGRELWFGFVDGKDNDSLIMNDGLTSVLLSLGNKINPNLFKSYEYFNTLNRDTVAYMLLSNIVSKRTPYALFLVNEIDKYIGSIKLTKYNKYKFIFIRHGRYIACYKLDNARTIYQYINSATNDMNRFIVVIDMLLSNTKESFLFNDSRLEIFYNSDYNLKESFLNKFVNDKGTLTNDTAYSLLNISDISFDINDINEFYYTLCNEYLVA